MGLSMLMSATTGTCGALARSPHARDADPHNGGRPWMIAASNVESATAWIKRLWGPDACQFTETVVGFERCGQTAGRRRRFFEVDQDRMPFH